MLSNKFEILFEDDYLIAINKPAKMLVIQDRFNKLEENLHDILKKECNEIFTLHRLDKETSGVLLFAKTAEAHRDLSIQFEKHKTQKTYTVLLNGVIKQDTGVIDLPLVKKSAHENLMVVDKKNGKPSLTDFKVIKRYRNFTLAEAYPRTGRTHQIRIHFKSIGYPLAIDKSYGTKDKIFLSDLKSKFIPSANEEKPLMERLTLHASALEFIHPITFEEMRIEASHHKDFRSLIKNLDKYGM